MPWQATQETVAPAAAPAAGAHHPGRSGPRPGALPGPAAYDVAREDDLDWASTEVRELFDRSDATLFQHPVWVGRIYRSLAPSRGASPLVVTVRVGGTGELAAVLPLVRRRRGGLRWVELADLGVCDYAAAIVDQVHREALLRNVTVGLRVRSVLGRYDVLRLERLTDPRDILAVLTGARTVRRHSYDSHVITLPADPAAWPDDVVEPKLVRHLERKRKRLRPKGGVALRYVTDHAEVDGLLRRMQGYRADRFAGRRATDLVQDPDCFEFYRAVAHDGLDRGPVRLAVLEVGGEPAAVALDLADEEQHVFVLVGYDVARLRNYALGLLVIDELVRSALADGLRFFDLTVGNESYKHELGARPVPVYAVRAARTWRGQAAGLAVDVDARARTVARWGRARWEDVRARRAEGATAG